MLQHAERFAPEVVCLTQAAERFFRSTHRTEGEALASDLQEVSRCLSLIQLKFSEMAASYAQTNHYDLQGSYSPLHWIRVNCHLTGGAGADRIAVGEQLGNVADSIEAMAGGEIGFPHLALIAREAQAHAESGTGQAFDEAQLLDKAKQLTVGRFRNFCYHQRHASAPEKYAAEQAELTELRTLDLRTGENGMLWIRGVLDPEGGAVLRNALRPLTKRHGQHDRRNLGKRQADALVELAGHGTSVQMQVTASIETLLGAVGAPGAESEFTLPMSAKTVERWSCDCSLSRVLLQDSVVIDIGRSERTIKGPRRRALFARDKHCQWPGCDRPASYCDGHHLKHWLRGGGGEIENQILLCRRHHWLVHEGGWQILRTSDHAGWRVIPPLFNHSSLPRGPSRYWAA